MSRAASRQHPAAAAEGPWLRGWAAPDLRAGITDRHTTAAELLEALEWPAAAVAAEQVHGGSVAIVECLAATAIPGCDALLTQRPGLALTVRSADCLPIFFADPARRVVGLAHAGWRGLAASLPARVIAAMRGVYHSDAGAVRVAIGPGIRACCYEVGPEFAERFGAFVRQRGGRRMCDLTGVARAQLLACGVRAERILDTGRCTACDTARWFSLRREGPETGRLTSLIALRP